jgi:hypothetical protein
MRKRTILALVVLVVVFGGLVAYRFPQVPSLLTVSVSLSLNRIRDYSYFANIPSFSIYLTSTNMTTNNVTFVENPYENKSLTSKVHWTLQIILNESETTNVFWERDIDPGLGPAGIYSGVVSTSFAAKDTFKIWIEISYVYEESSTSLWSTSETIQVH